MSGTLPLKFSLPDTPSVRVPLSDTPSVRVPLSDTPSVRVSWQQTLSHGEIQRSSVLLLCAAPLALCTPSMYTRSPRLCTPPIGSQHHALLPCFPTPKVIDTLRGEYVAVAAPRPHLALSAWRWVALSARSCTCMPPAEWWWCYSAHDLCRMVDDLHLGGAPTEDSPHSDRL